MYTSFIILNLNKATVKMNLRTFISEFFMCIKSESVVDIRVFKLPKL